MPTSVNDLAEATELATVFRTYNEVTERLKQSHELLRAEVCRLHAQLEEKDRALERHERLAALGEMAAGVAHEIRNPLGGIGLYASLLERDLSQQPAPLQIARRISVGVRNIESIVADILAFAGGAEPNRRPTRLLEIIEAALAQVEAKALAKGAVIDVAAELAPVMVAVDAAHVQRAVVNLILNALDAIAEGGRIWLRMGKPRGECRRVRRADSSFRPRTVRSVVATRTGPHGEPGAGADLFTLVIEDDGPGILPGLAQRVFDPFFTTKGTGTGLGLAIVHRIAESHGGSVRVGMREGGGAAFALALPLVEAAKPPIADAGGLAAESAMANAKW